MELIDIELALRLREYQAPLPLEQARALFGPQMQDRVAEAINRLASPKLRMVEVVNGEIWLTLAGRLFARHLAGSAEQVPSIS
jgi:hypothetical protein